ncbi:MAG: hypothetical protein R2800_09300 [Flavipsychrobacter sp.]
MKKLFLVLLAGSVVVGCNKASNEANISPDNGSAAVSKKSNNATSNKVKFRHNGSIIQVSANAMAAHFGHGDQMVVQAGDMAANLNDVAAAPYKWFFYNDQTDVIDNALGSFVSGPGTTPYGSGSAQISVSGSQRRNLATYQFAGTPLASISVLAFSTYNPSAGNGGAANRSAYLNFNVDFDGSDTWQRRLIFTPPSGAVSQDTWQEWDCIDNGNAVWRWSGGTFPGTAVTSMTWSDLLSTYPGIRIRVSDPWLGIRVGSPYASGYTENIDGFKLNNKVFDFEN